MSESVVNTRPSDYAWLSDEVNDSPYDFYAALQREAPVYRYPGTNLYGTDVYLVSRWEDIAHVVQRPDEFVQFLGDAAPQYTEIFGACPFPHAPRGAHTPYPTFYSDGDDHRAKRTWARQLVEREVLARAEGVIADLTHQLLDGLVDDGECEFRTAVCEPLPARIIASVVGTPVDEVSSWVGRDPSRPPNEQPAHRYVERHILRRYRDPGDDLMSRMIADQCRQDGGLDLNFQVANWANVLTAGSVTSVQMLANMMALLARHPESMSRVRTDRDALRRAVEESLRVETPVQVLPRRAVADCEVGGVAIPAGSVLALLYGAGNRDAAKFDRPEVFDIDRPHVQRTSLAFGRGKHLCAGAPLARLEGEVTFQCLFQRMENIRFDEERSDLTKISGRNGVDFGPKRVFITFDAVDRR